MGASFATGIVQGGVDEYNQEQDTDSKKPKKPKKQNLKTNQTQVPGSAAAIQNFKRGGKIKGRKGKAVMIKAHAGERVLTEKQQRRMKRRMGGKRGAGRRR